MWKKKLNLTGAEIDIGNEEIFGPDVFSLKYQNRKSSKVLQKGNSIFVGQRYRQFRWGSLYDT